MTAPLAQKARPALALLAITALGAAVRFSKLDFQSFWLDEHHARA
jgi:hypothetical protein